MPSLSSIPWLSSSLMTGGFGDDSCHGPERGNNRNSMQDQCLSRSPCLAIGSTVTDCRGISLPSKLLECFAT